MTTRVYSGSSHLPFMAYDERWAKAAKAYTEALLDKTKDNGEAWNTMQSIEASRPNVDFLDDDMLSSWDIAFGAELKRIFVAVA